MPVTAEQNQAGIGKSHSHCPFPGIASKSLKTSRFSFNNPNDFELLFSLWDFLKIEK
jgi:hypothetical protein